MVHGLFNLGVGLVTESLYTFSTVESHSDLLICIHEALKLSVKFDILSCKNIAMVLKGVYLGAHVCV